MPLLFVYFDIDFFRNNLKNKTIIWALLLRISDFVPCYYHNFLQIRKPHHCLKESNLEFLLFYVPSTYQ